MIRTTERRADARRVAGTGTRWPTLAVLFNRQITLPRPGQPLIGKQFFMQVPLLGLLAPSFYIAQFTAELVDQSIVNQATPAGNFLWRIGCWAGIMAVFLALATMFARRVGYQMAGDARLWLYTRLMSTGEGDLATAAAVRLAQAADPDLEIVERLPGTAPGLVALVALAAGATLYVFESSPPLGIALILGLLAALGCGILAGAGDGSAGLVLGGALEAVVLWLGGRLAAGAHLWFGRHPTDGTLVVALGAAMVAGPIAVHTRALVRDLDRARDVDERLASVLAVGHPPRVGGHPLPAPSSGLELSGVRVNVAGVALVDAVDLRVARGEITILSAPAQPVLGALGATAAGLRAAGEGVVRLDGMAVEDANTSELRRALRLVRKDPMLLAGSLRQNVTVGGGDDVPDDAVREALEAAGAGRLAERDGGLDADVGPNGTLLSTAERQRVALARALVGHPRVLVLDDALSALNGDEEEATIESVRRTYGGLGLLVLTTRRPPDIPGAHRVLLPTTTTTPPAAPDAGETPTGSTLIQVEAADDGGTSGRRLAGWGQAAVLVPLQVVPALVLARIVALVAPDRQEAMGRWALALGGMVALYGVGLALVGAWSRRRRSSAPGEAPPDGRPAGASVPPTLAVTGAGALVVMLVVSPLAVAAPLAVLLAGLAAAWVVRAAVGRAVRWSEHQRQRTASLLLDHLHARPAIQVLGAERACTARYVSATWEWRRSRWWLSVLTTVPAALVQGAALTLPGVVLTLQYGNVLGAHEAASTALCLGSLAWLLAVCVVGAAVQPTWAGAGPPPVLGQSTQA